MGGEAGNYNQLGSSNVFLGYKAGYSETGSGKLYISNEDGQDLITGDFTNGQATPVVDGQGGLLGFHAVKIFMWHVPEDLQNGATVDSGQLYKDGSGFLKIKA